MSYQPKYMIVNHRDSNFCVVIRDNLAVLARVDSGDINQRWWKIDDASPDTEGQPAFNLVNVATKEKLKGGHFRNTASSEVNSVLWSLSKESFQGFRLLRMVNNFHRQLVPSNHGMTDGNWVDLWDGPKDNISLHWKFEQDGMFTISCARTEGYNLTVHDEAVVLARADAKNEYQVFHLLP